MASCQAAHVNRSGQPLSLRRDLRLAHMSVVSGKGVQRHRLHGFTCQICKHIRVSAKSALKLGREREKQETLTLTSLSPPAVARSPAGPKLREYTGF